MEVSVQCSIAAFRYRNRGTGSGVKPPLQKLSCQFSAEGRNQKQSMGSKQEGKVLEARLLQRVNQTIADRQLLHTNQRILLAVSGGQDSACLMHLLTKLRSQWSWELGVAHCDHQWSDTAREQASHVAQFAKSLSLDYYQALTTRPVPGEEVARTWRYGVLQRIAVAHGYEAIVTAHTASDRTETLLYNLFRGSGLGGLQSLTWKRMLSPASRQSAFSEKRLFYRTEDPSGQKTEHLERSVALVRPLLNVSRTELRELSQLLELPLWPDQSNYSLEMDRNRIRHQLLPYVRKQFNPGVDKTLARYAEILNGEEAFLDNLCETIRLKAESPLLGPEEEEIGKRLDFSKVRAVPIALQRRVIKQFIERVTGTSSGFDLVERLRLIYSQSSIPRKGLRISVRGGFYLHLFAEEVHIFKGVNERLRKSSSMRG